MEFFQHKMIRKFITGAILIAACFAGGANASDKPNIIFFLADDLGYADTGYTGATGFKTPNIDRLAAEGLTFTHFRTAASICSPSRAAFLTGGYPQRAGLYLGINPIREARWFLGLNPGEITIAEQLKKAGYRTFQIGKWHLGTEPEFLPDNHHHGGERLRTGGVDHRGRQHIRPHLIAADKARCERIVDDEPVTIAIAIG